MKILSLVEEAEIAILQQRIITNAMSELSQEIQAQHEKDLKHAFCRGQISMLRDQEMTAEQYYKKFYTDEI